MTRPRDSQRAKVWRAEEALILGARLRASKAKKNAPNSMLLFPALRMWDTDIFVREVINSRWWKQHAPAGLYLNPAVVDWKVKYCDLVRNDWKPGYDCLSLQDRNHLSVLHALAHKLTDEHVAHHGPEFVRHYIRLVDRFIGIEAGKALRAAFAGEKIKSRALSDETKLARAVQRATRMVKDMEKEKA
jgi:hypothetical protein